MSDNISLGSAERLAVGAIHLREAARSISHGSTGSARESLKTAAAFLAIGDAGLIAPLTKVQDWVANLFQVDLANAKSGQEDHFAAYAAFESEAVSAGMEAPGYAASLLLGLAHQLDLG